MSYTCRGRTVRDNRAGFTLIELVIVIVTLGILAAVAIPRFADMAEASKTNATLEEMMTLRKAIIGDLAVVAGGEFIDRGFEGDLGFLPTDLRDLAARPDSIPPYDPFTRLGWNGPYIDSGADRYLADAWGNSYLYLPASRLIRSTGGGSDTIEVTF